MGVNGTAEAGSRCPPASGPALIFERKKGRRQEERGGEEIKFLKRTDMSSTSPFLSLNTRESSFSRLTTVHLVLSHNPYDRWATMWAIIRVSVSDTHESMD